jgi:serine/threonine protein kinase
MAITADNLKLLLTEITIMKNTQHRNIVKFHDSFMVEQELWVVMELMDGGCLTDVLEQFDSVKLSEAQMAHVCMQVQPHIHPTPPSFFLIHFGSQSKEVLPVVVLVVHQWCPTT